MPVFDLQCDNCGEELTDVLLPAEPTKEKCPNCASLMRRKFGGFAIRGFFHWMGDRGKEERIVSYPGGHTRRKSHNELYSSGGL